MRRKGETCLILRVVLWIKYHELSYILVNGKTKLKETYGEKVGQELNSAFSCPPNHTTEWLSKMPSDLLVTRESHGSCSPNCPGERYWQSTHPFVLSTGVLMDIGLWWGRVALIPQINSPVHLPPSYPLLSGNVHRVYSSYARKKWASSLSAGVISFLLPVACSGKKQGSESRSSKVTSQLCHLILGSRRKFLNPSGSSALNSPSLSALLRRLRSKWV